MAIRKFLRELGEKILPSSKKEKSGDNQQQQFSGNTPGQQQSTGRSQQPAGRPAPRGGDDEASEIILEYIRVQCGSEVPVDLLVAYDEAEGTVVLEGTVPNEEQRERLVQLAGNIQGVEKVDDRLTVARSGAQKDSSPQTR
jgi:osmotically-inducible protein OsmY